ANQAAVPSAALTRQTTCSASMEIQPCRALPPPMGQPGIRSACMIASSSTWLQVPMKAETKAAPQPMGRNSGWRIRRRPKPPRYLPLGAASRASTVAPSQVWVMPCSSPLPVSITSNGWMSMTICVQPNTSSEKPPRNADLISRPGPMCRGVKGMSGSARVLLHERRLQLHRADAVDPAVDIVVAVDQADAAHLGADLHHRGRALDLQVLDDDHGVAVGQRGAVGVAHDLHVPGVGLGGFAPHPGMAAFRAGQAAAVGVGVFGAAGGAGRQGVHAVTSTRSTLVKPRGNMWPRLARAPS